MIFIFSVSIFIFCHLCTKQSKTRMLLRKKASFWIDILLIITTIIMVIFPKINLYKYFFGDLPKHPLFNPE